MPYPTQPLPPYQPPPQSGQWGGSPPPPPGPPAPPGSPWGPPPPPRRSNTTLIVILAIVGVLLVAGAATGIIVATGGKKKHNSQASTPPATASSVASSHDFPTDEPTDLPTDQSTDEPTDSSGADTPDQDAIAHNAETVLHAIGDSDSATFCPLIDPADLRRLLKEKSLTNCNQIALKSSADKAEYKGFTVDDPAEIEVTGTSAHIPAAAISPSSFGAVDMRKDTDGNWKFRFYAS